MQKLQQLGMAGLASVLAALTLCLPALADDIVISIRTPDTGLLRSPDFEAEVIRRADQGDRFVAVTTVKEFYLVRDDETGAFLYVPFQMADELVDELPENYHVSGQAEAPSDHDLSYWNVKPNRANQRRLRSQSKNGMLTAHNGKKFPASYEYNENYRPKIDGRQLVRDARRFMGADYVLGGVDTGGIDCSGLVKVCLANQGIELVHRSSLQALEGKYVHHSDLRSGDIVYFRDDVDTRYLSHVGIYIGNGRFIHASQSAGEVTITNLSSTYFKSHYAFARRM